MTAEYEERTDNEILVPDEGCKADRVVGVERLTGDRCAVEPTVVGQLAEAEYDLDKLFWGRTLSKGTGRSIGDPNGVRQRG